MHRASMAVLFGALLAVGASRLPSAGQGPGKEPAPPDREGPSRRPDLDDATLRPLLREAASKVVAAKGEAGDMQRSRTFDVLANAQESVGDFEGARLSREESEKASASNPGNLSWVRRERTQDLIRDNKLKEAERLFEETARLALEPGRPGGVARVSDPFYVVLTGTWLAESLARDKEFEAARRVLLRARAVAEADTSIEYGFFVAREQAKIGEIAAARATLDAIQSWIDRTSDQDRRLYSVEAMICARWALGDREAARSLYKRLSEFARSRPVERFERSNAMNRLPTILAAIGDYEAAFRMVDEEIDDRLKGSLFHSVVEVVARSSGLTSHADEARAYPPIDGEAARSALRLAAKFAGGSRHDDIRNTLGSIAIYQAKLGDLEGARQSSRVLAAAGDGEAGASTGAQLLIELARAEWKAGAREAAEADFASALRAADALPERSEQRFGRWPTTTHPRDGAIVAVVLARAELGDVGGAIEAAARVREPVEKANALASAAGDRRDGKDLAGAARLAKAEGHGFPSIGVLVGIADAQDRAGDPEGSRATLRLALGEAEDYLEKRPHDPTIPPHNPSMVITHWDRPPEGRDREIRQHATAAFEVAEIRSKLGDIAGALRALESVADEQWRENGLLGIILNQLRAGDAHGAFARAYQLPTASRRLTAIFCLSGAVKSLKSTTGPRPPAP